MNSFLTVPSDFVCIHIPVPLSLGTCFWTRFCASHFEAPHVLQAVHTAEIPGQMHGGGVSFHAGRIYVFKSPQAEAVAEVESCTE